MDPLIKFKSSPGESSVNLFDTCRTSVAVILVLLAVTPFKSMADEAKSCPAASKILKQFSDDDQKFKLDANEIGSPDNWNDPEFCKIPDEIPSIELRLGAWRNQHERNWCYAEVAADLATFTVGRYVSAASLAINYLYLDNMLKTNQSNNQSSTSLKDALAIYIKPNGTEHLALKFLSYYCSFDTIFDKAFSQLSKERFAEDIHAIQMAAKNRTVSTRAKAAIQELFGSSYDIERELKKSNPADSIYQLIYSHCQKDPIPISESYKFENSFGIGTSAKLGMLNKVIKHLKKGLPAGVTFNLYDFLNPGAREHADPSQFQTVAQGNSNLQKEQNSPECKNVVDDIESKLGKKPISMHAVTAVGLKYDVESHRCMMRLRNSWGGRCNSINQDKAKCELESLLVPLDYLVDNLEAVELVEPVTQTQ